MEKTLVILKPDCMEKRNAGKVISRFEKAGYSIAACKLEQLQKEVLEQHYDHIRRLKDIFPMLVDFMASRPVLVMILEGDGVIAGVRDLLGPTDPEEAPEGTIRGDLGSDKTMNVAHASDSPDTARVEIERFFG